MRKRKGEGIIKQAADQHLCSIISTNPFSFLKEFIIELVRVSKLVSRVKESGREPRSLGFGPCVLLQVGYLFDEGVSTEAYQTPDDLPPFVNDGV